MAAFGNCYRCRPRLILLPLVAIGVLLLLINVSLLSDTPLRSTIKKIPLPSIKSDSGPPKTSDDGQEDKELDGLGAIEDHHPIGALIKGADETFADYVGERSTNFKETVAKYRMTYGRHPPPGFREWYKFAKDRDAYNINDFQQVMDDLRPFWGIEPSVIRAHAAHIEKHEHLSGLHIRNHKIWKLTKPGWRVETFAKMVKKFVKYLPDMDIAMNMLDQPRLVVPWDNLQALLAKEIERRHLPVETLDEWTKDMPGFYEGSSTAVNISDAEWYPIYGQDFMKTAREACPPESHARNSTLSSSSSQAQAEFLFKDPQAGFITNFNRSSDLCVVGPELLDKHGLLYAPSMIVASKLLLPVFSECKTNINNDILFPANMYYENDERYVYDGTFDDDWPDKEEKAVWRGVTSGGVNSVENWRHLHRNRFVLMTNSTELGDSEVRITSVDPSHKGYYQNFDHFKPSEFVEKHTDIGFTEGRDCYPDCDFFGNVWTYKPKISLSHQFKSKFVIDVDGHSFSGRFRAFLLSKSLPIKSTIFREWHSSRIFAWRHFVPFDNRFDDIYSLLTYFIGLGNPTTAGTDGKPYMPRHDFEAQTIGKQGREWAETVLRLEDMEIYTYRLLLEYGRLIDDNRDRIGYSGDGSELDKYDSSFTH